MSLKSVVRRLPAAASLLLLAALSGCHSRSDPAPSGHGQPPPTLSAVTPSSGTTAGGTVVTLTGTGFRAGATVRFGTAAASSVTVASATSITAATPAAAAGTVAVTVTNTDSQSATLPAAFTFVGAPPQGACASEPLTGTTIYYVCDCQAGAEAGCVAGADSSAGTSPAAPWRSFIKGYTQFQTMAAGATVAFCRGGSWTGAGNLTDTNPIRNTSCTAASPCTMRDYQAPWGGTARPQMQLPNIAPGYNFALVGWYQNYTESVHGLRFWNISVIGNYTAGGDEYGIMFWGGATDVDICNMEFSRLAASAVDLVTSSTLARITVRESYLHDLPNHICAVCGAADDFVIDGNVFDLIGGPDNRRHSVYFYTPPGEPQCGNGGPQVDTYCVAHRLRLSNNTITRTAHGTGNSCMGVAVEAHDPLDTVTVEDNFISEPAGTADPGCYGIQFSNGGESAHFTNLVIRRNRIFNVGGNGIAVSGAPGVIIENNLIVGGLPLYIGISYPEEPYQSATDLQSRDGRVRNNTIYLPGGGGGSFAMTGLNEGTGHVIANNAVVTTPASDCFKTPAGATVLTNTCSETGAGWWRAPGLDPNTADFRPAVGSPLLGGGTEAQAPATDITGATRGAPPTIGAYEQ
jgi:hypothetical protein